MIVERAQAADVMVWAAACGFPLPRLQYKSLIAQVVIAEAFTLREVENGDPLVIAGCVDLDPEQPGEIFFLAPPGGLGRKLVTVHLLARRWLAIAAEARPMGLVCWVREDNPRGQRLARALGFAPTGIGAAWQQWRFAHVASCQESRGPVRRRGR